jgi:hypothetical protein
VLDLAILRRDKEVIGLATRSGRDLLRDLADHYAESSRDANRGIRERALARASLAALMQFLQNIHSDVDGGRYANAAGEYLNYRKLAFATVPITLQAAEAFSSFAQ